MQVTADVTAPELVGYDAFPTPWDLVRVSDTVIALTLEMPTEHHVIWYSVEGDEITHLATAVAPLASTSPLPDGPPRGAALSDTSVILWTVETNSSTSMRTYVAHHCQQDAATTSLVLEMISANPVQNSIIGLSGETITGLFMFEVAVPTFAATASSAVVFTVANAGSEDFRINYLCSRVLTVSPSGVLSAGPWRALIGYQPSAEGRLTRFMGTALDDGSYALVGTQKVTGSPGTDMAFRALKIASDGTLLADSVVGTYPDPPATPLISLPGGGVALILPAQLLRLSPAMALASTAPYGVTTYPVDPQPPAYPRPSSLPVMHSGVMLEYEDPTSTDRLATDDGEWTLWDANSDRTRVNDSGKTVGASIVPSGSQPENPVGASLFYRVLPINVNTAVLLSLYFYGFGHPSNYYTLRTVAWNEGALKVQLGTEWQVVGRGARGRTQGRLKLYDGERWVQEFVDGDVFAIRTVVFGPGLGEASSLGSVNGTDLIATVDTDTDNLVFTVVPTGAPVSGATPTRLEMRAFRLPYVVEETEEAPPGTTVNFGGSLWVPASTGATPYATYDQTKAPIEWHQFNVPIAPAGGTETERKVAIHVTYRVTSGGSSINAILPMQGRTVVLGITGHPLKVYTGTEWANVADMVVAP